MKMKHLTFDQVGYLYNNADVMIKHYKQEYFTEFT